MRGLTKRRRLRVVQVLVLAVFLTLALFAGSGSASKEILSYFGTEEGTGSLGGEFTGPGDAAVNSNGAGPAEEGDVYVVDNANQRIQRFDGTGNFISAWGADVSTPAAGSSYEICTVAANCKAGVASGVNGGLSSPSGVAVDLDTGDVYVADTGNRRVSVYTGDGEFLRSFGWDVVASGPGDAGSGYEICVAANGDVCKAGATGSGAGQIGGSLAAGIAVSQPDDNATAGTVFLTDNVNRRVNTYKLDGSGPSSFGSSAQLGPFKVSAIAVDSRGIVYISDSENGQEIDRYDTEDANGEGVGFLKSMPARTITANGGPGDAAGSNPYTITFQADLGETDVGQLAVSNGTTPLSGGSGASVTTTTPGGPGTDEVQQLTVSATAGQFRLTFEGQTTGDINFSATSDTVSEALAALSSVPKPPLLPSNNNGTVGLEVDPDSDGPGPDVDTLYVLRTASSTGVVRSVVQQFGPLNAPGLTAPPSAVDDTHGTVSEFNFVSGLGLNDAGSRLFVSTFANVGGDYNPSDPATKSGVYILDTPLPQPTVTLDSISGVTETTATVNATIDANGPPDVSYRLEYSTDGSSWMSTTRESAGSDDDPQSIAALLNPLGGLEPKTLYHVRVVVQRPNYPAVTSNEETFTTLAAPPQAETTGSPTRSATTARLEGRVGPRNSATTYHFEYGSEGPCDANPCASTASRSAGSGSLLRPVSEDIDGLAPNTVYHYRLVAESSASGSPVSGEDMTLATRASDDPLEHGLLPGPPGSDRAYELVSIPDTSGNPVLLTSSVAISDDGNRATYGVAGGTSQSDSGSVLNQFFAQRTASGWKTEAIYPKRDELTGTNWFPPVGPRDLSQFVALNASATGDAQRIFRLVPGKAATRLFVAPPVRGSSFAVTTDDTSVTVTMVEGSLDPDNPTPDGFDNFYDIASGEPKLLSLLPGDVVAQCGIDTDTPDGSSGAFVPNNETTNAGWLSADGARLFFPSRGADCDQPFQLYMRDLGAEQTTRISPPPVSGRDCGSAFVKGTPEAVFFWSQSRLVTSDVAAKGCKDDEGEGDVYRYGFDSGDLSCLTCVSAPGADVGLDALSNLRKYMAVSDDGSRLYFKSPNRLLPGAATPGIYRVDVASDEIAYVAPADDVTSGDNPRVGNALNTDGSTFIFTSANPALNPLNGSDNHGIRQYYRYDDRDRSLVCVSCMPDGSVGTEVSDVMQASVPVGANSIPVDDAGDFVFTTADPLVSADQNTNEDDPGTGSDIYEWRDGRLMLITDGLRNWVGGSAAGPSIAGITPSGHDIFFAVPAQYTADALDSYNRYYTARIGGGFEIPPPPKPCPLEVCQGIPKGAPEEAAPGTGTFSGPGNLTKTTPRKRCPKGKRKMRRANKTRCVKPKKNATKKKKASKANNNRRASR